MTGAMTTRIPGYPWKTVGSNSRASPRVFQRHHSGGIEESADESIQLLRRLPPIPPSVHFVVKWSIGGEERGWVYVDEKQGICKTRLRSLAGLDASEPRWKFLSWSSPHAVPTGNATLLVIDGIAEGWCGLFERDLGVRAIPVTNESQNIYEADVGSFDPRLTALEADLPSEVGVTDGERGVHHLLQGRVAASCRRFPLGLSTGVNTY